MDALYWGATLRILDEMLEIFDCDRVSPDSCRVRAKSHMFHILEMYVCVNTRLTLIN